MDMRKIPDDELSIDNAANCPDAGFQRSQSKRISLRHVLRALAGDPESVAKPRMAIARLRLIVQSERARTRIDQRSATIRTSRPVTGRDSWTAP
jgi:hypothetical protein